MLQKLKTSVSLLLFPLVLVVLVGPLLVSTPAFAAKTYPKGTCFYHGPGGDKTQSCSSLGVKTNQKDNKGKAVSYGNCYEVDASLSTETIIQVNCDGSSIDKTPSQQMCPNPKGGKDVPCIVCPDQSFAATAADCSQADPAATSGNCSNLSKCDLISKYINPVISFLAALVGVAVVISIVIGGIQYGSSAGDPQKVSAAKNRIRNAVIALVTFIFLYAMLNFLIPGGLF